MGFLFGLFYFVLIPAGIAAALATALATFMPTASLRRRTTIAALSAGFLPMLVPISALLTTAADPIALVALVVTALVLAALFGLPVALFLGRRHEQPQPPEKIFE